MSCLFRLDHYQIESVAVILNDGYDPELKAHTGDLTSTMTVAPHKGDAQKVMLVLEIMARPKKDHEAEFFPYSVVVKGRGFFSFRNKIEKAEAHKVLCVNGAAILYGLLRGQVAQITAQSVHGQFLLPTVNFVEMQNQAVKAEPPKQSAKKAAASRKPAGSKKRRA